MKLTELATQGKYSIYIKDKNSENVIDVKSKHYIAGHDGEGPTWLLNEIISPDYERDNLSKYFGLYDDGATVLLAYKMNSYILISGLYTKRYSRRKNHAKNLVSLFIKTIFEQTDYKKICLRMLDDKNSLKNLYIKSADLAKCDIKLFSVKNYTTDFNYEFKHPFDVDQACEKLHSDDERYNAVAEIVFIKYTT